MSLLSSTEIQECGHPANFCHECEGDLNTCGFNGNDHGESDRERVESKIGPVSDEDWSSFEGKYL